MDPESRWTRNRISPVPGQHHSRYFWEHLPGDCTPEAFPRRHGGLYGLAAAVAIPALPVVLAQIPLKVVVMNLLRTLR